MPTTRSQFAQQDVMAITAENLGLHLIEALKHKDVVAAFTAAISAPFEQLKKELKAAQDSLQTKDKEINDLKQSVKALADRVDKLEDGLDQQEQQGRKPSIRVFGIPERPNETAGQLEASVLDVLQNKLQINAIEASDLEVIHRCGPMPQPAQNGADPPKPRSVIVKFHHRRKRSEVFKKGVLGKLKNTGISVSEDLSKRRAAIAFDCRVKVREKRISQTWSANGKIIIKDNAGLIRHIKTRAEAQAL